MTDPDSGEPVVDEWWAGHGLAYESSTEFAPGITAYRCAGTVGCGALLLDLDFDLHAKWHIVRLKVR